MDIVTFALCKKMTQNGVSSDEVQQQIDEIKNSISELQTGQGESDLEIQAIQTAIQSIEGKVNEVQEVQTDIILAELRDVREQLSLKVSARIVE